MSDGSAPSPGECTQMHTRLLKCTLEVEHSRAYWRHRAASETRGVSPVSASYAQDHYWFGSRSLARTAILLTNLRARFDAFPGALSTLSAWPDMSPRSQRLVCHWHLQLWMESNRSRSLGTSTIRIRQRSGSTSMTLPLLDQMESHGLRDAFASLRKDLIQPQGPSISTMRNYRFALLQYEPKDEFLQRAEVQRLSGDLAAHDWVVLTISLQALLIKRVQAQGDDWIQRVIDRERRISGKGVERGLNELKTKLSPLIEGPDGLAADCASRIQAFRTEHPDKAERTLTIIGRAGSLYPFFRSSALLRHLDGKTGNVPVLLLYPGTRRGRTGLSFMGEIVPDSDYRPRIYS